MWVLAVCVGVMQREASRFETIADIGDFREVEESLQLPIGGTANMTHTKGETSSFRSGVCGLPPCTVRGYAVAHHGGWLVVVYSAGV